MGSCFASYIFQPFLMLVCISNANDLREILTCLSFCSRQWFSHLLLQLLTRTYEKSVWCIIVRVTHFVPCIYRIIHVFSLLSLWYTLCLHTTCRQPCFLILWLHNSRLLFVWSIVRQPETPAARVEGHGESTLDGTWAERAWHDASRACRGHLNHEQPNT